MKVDVDGGHLEVAEQGRGSVIVRSTGALPLCGADFPACWQGSGA